MNFLPKGKFYGQTNETISLDGITLTATEYTLDKVDWHYHENPYLTFIIQGKLIEGNKKEVYSCSAGTLLFHNWQEPHYNIKPNGFTKGFHIELEQKWASSVAFDLGKLQGNILVSNPNSRILLYKLFKESKINDNATELSIQGLLVQTLISIQCTQVDLLKTNPPWVKKVREMLHEQCCGPLSLTQLANELNIHPVHLSRDFPRYFHSGFGEYVRRLKVEKSLSLLPLKKQSLAAIAFECGFSDQSHFIRCFKEMMGVSPLAYRKIVYK